MDLLQYIGELRELHVHNLYQFHVMCERNPVWATRVASIDGPVTKRARSHSTTTPARRDHPVVDYTAGGSKELALSKIVSEAGRMEVLRKAEERAVTAVDEGQPGGFVAYVDYFLTCSWGLPPLPLTADKVRAVLASFQAGRYRAPEQYVSEARRRHTLWTGSTLDPATELVIRDYVRSCKRGIGPPSAKDDFNFESLFHIEMLFKGADEPRAPMFPAYMLFLNIWWATREIEASAARFFHVTIDHENMVVSWLLPVSKRDPFAVGETRSHGCGCIAGVRHPVCPYHLFKEYLSLIIGVFGCDIEDPVRAFPLFPTSNGATLHKHHVVAAYREVIAHAGVNTTKIDGQGRVRQRFGGHVCRVVGAIWLFKHLKELYLVQLFARWGSKSIERYIQSAPLRNQSSFAARVLSSLTLEEVERRARTAKSTNVVEAAPSINNHSPDLLDSLQRRLARLEVSVGDRAPCVRNLVSRKSTGGCVHKVSVDSPDRTCCGWIYGSQVHLRMDQESVDRLPPHLRCEVCWQARGELIDEQSSGDSSSDNSDGGTSVSSETQSCSNAASGSGE